MTKRTTINIKQELADALKLIKEYPRETYDETLERDPRLKRALKKVRAKLKKV